MHVYDECNAHLRISTFLVASSLRSPFSSFDFHFYQTFSLSFRLGIRCTLRCIHARTLLASMHSIFIIQAATVCGKAQLCFCFTFEAKSAAYCVPRQVYSNLSKKSPRCYVRSFFFSPFGKREREFYPNN